ALGEEPDRHPLGAHVEAVLLHRLLEDAPARGLEFVAPRLVRVLRHLGERHVLDAAAIEEGGPPEAELVPGGPMLVQHGGGTPSCSRRSISSSMPRSASAARTVSICSTFRTSIEARPPPTTIAPSTASYWGPSYPRSV